MSYVSVTKPNLTKRKRLKNQESEIKKTKSKQILESIFEKSHTHTLIRCVQDKLCN